MSRLTLSNGDWVDLVDRLNYAQALRIRVAARGSDDVGTIVAAMATNWALRDVNDQPIDFPGAGPEGIALDALSRIPWDVFQEIGKAATEILPGQPDPKDGAGTSPGSPPSGKRRSRTSLEISTSSPITPDGPGTTYNGHPRT